MDNKNLHAYTENNVFVKGYDPARVIEIHNADELQDEIKEAIKTGTPLVPVSSAGNHRKGGVCPGAKNATILDLSGMDEIISISRKHRMVVVEPGVTFPRLNAALKAEGLYMTQPIAQRPGKSVLTSVLERNPSMNVNRNWNYVDPLSCVGLVWGDGLRMCTGEAFGGSFNPLDQQKTEKFQINGAGPMMIDYSRLLTGSSGTLGVVAWAALRCNVLPETRRLFIAASSDFAGIEKFVYELLHHRAGDQLFIMNRCALAMLLGDESLKRELPLWLAVAVAESRPHAPQSRILAHGNIILSAAGNSGIKILDGINGHSDEEILDAMFENKGDVYWHDAFGKTSELFFNTTLDKSYDFIMDMERAASIADIDTDDVGIYIQPRHTGTAVRVEFILPEDEKMFTRLAKAVSVRGAYFAEPYGMLSELQYEKDEFGTEMLIKLKNIFDPKRILNPGKLCFK